MTDPSPPVDAPALAPTEGAASAAPGDPKKGALVEAHGAAVALAVGPYGSPAEWSTPGLASVTLKVLRDHAGFFGAIAIGNMALDLVPRSNGILTLLLTLTCLGGALQALDRDGSLDVAEIFQRVHKRAAVLFGAQLVMLMMAVAAGGLAWAAGVPLPSLTDAGGLAFVRNVVLAIPFAFLLSMPFFLGVVVIDGAAGVGASIGLALRLYLGWLPGNVALVTFSWVSLLAVAVLPSALLGLDSGLASSLGVALAATFHNVLLSARYRQLLACSELQVPKLEEGAA